MPVPKNHQTHNDALLRSYVSGLFFTASVSSCILLFMTFLVYALKAWFDYLPTRCTRMNSDTLLTNTFKCSAAVLIRVCDSLIMIYVGCSAARAVCSPQLSASTYLLSASTCLLSASYAQNICTRLHISGWLRTAVVSCVMCVVQPAVSQYTSFNGHVRPADGNITLK